MIQIDECINRSQGNDEVERKIGSAQSIKLKITERGMDR